MGIYDSLVGAGGGLLGAGINAWSQHSTNKLNEKLMRESWARDDTAVQRRAADMEAAGFNPVLATGAAANNTGPIKLDAPEYGNMATGAIAGAQGLKDIARTEEQERLLKAQADKETALAQMAEVEAWEKAYLAGRVVATPKDYKRPDESGMSGPDLYHAAEEAKLRQVLNATDDFDKKLIEAQKYYPELAELEVKLKKAGLTKEEADIALKAETKRLLEKEVKWYGWKSAFGIASQAVGTAARAAVTPW